MVYCFLFSENLSTLTCWCSGIRLSLTTGFLRYGVEYQQGRLIVPVTGTYLVYSYLELYDTLSSNLSIRHEIFKFNVLDFEENVLVCKTQSRENSSNGLFSYYSSYISTVVKLRAGEEVSIKLNDVSLLRYPENNFFGVNFLFWTTKENIKFTFMSKEVSGCWRDTS